MGPDQILERVEKEVAAEAAANAGAGANAGANAGPGPRVDEPIELSDEVLDCLNHLFHGFSVHEDVDSIRAILHQLHTGPLVVKGIENAPVSDEIIRAASARLNSARGVSATGNNAVLRYRSRAPNNSIYPFATRKARVKTKYIPIFFEFITKHLLNASISGVPYVFKSYGSDKYLELEDTLTHISGGTYGKVYQGRTHFIYKEMRNSNIGATETFCRNVFLEALINVILQHDPRYGAHVGRLIKIFKHPKFDDIVNPVQILYFMLEPIEYTLTSYLAQPQMFVNPSGYMYPIFYQLGAVLEHFDAQYGFRHGDLHRGNIMLTPDGKVKIIDFGFACVRGYTKIAKQPCESYDFLILLFNLFTRTERVDYIPGFKTIEPILKKILSDGTNRPNIYAVLQTLYLEIFSWHFAYYNYFLGNVWSNTIGTVIRHRPVFRMFFPFNMYSMTLRDWFLSSIKENLVPANFKMFWLLPGQDVYVLPMYTYPTPCGNGPMRLIEVLPHEQEQRGRNQGNRRRNHTRNRSRSRPRN